jgi:hypothetical protein
MSPAFENWPPISRAIGQWVIERIESVRSQMADLVIGA